MIGAAINRAARRGAIRAARMVAALGYRARRTTKDSNEEVRRQNTRLDAALQHMSQGLCMFDAERRLIVCNDRFADLFALPAILTRPYTGPSRRGAIMFAFSKPRWTSACASATP
jgi:PAS domain-containing protein